MMEIKHTTFQQTMCFWFESTQREVPKNKSHLLDMTWFRCNADNGTRAWQNWSNCWGYTFYILLTSPWPAASAIRLSVVLGATSERERLHTGREIKLNILVINVWKAEGESCCSWSPGSKGWMGFKASLTACFASLCWFRQFASNTYTHAHKRRPMCGAAWHKDRWMQEIHKHKCMAP